MTQIEKALIYNRKIRDALVLLYNELNRGQQQKIIKNPEIKALLVRYGVINAD